MKLFTSRLIKSSLLRFCLKKKKKIVSSGFSFGTICFIRFLGSSYHVPFIFSHFHDIDDCVVNLNLP